VKALWIGHILRRNCLLQQVTEGKIKQGIEVKGRRGRRVGHYWMTLRRGVERRGEERRGEERRGEDTLI
jgi:hypothetical protein